MSESEPDSIDTASDPSVRGGAAGVRDTSAPAIAATVALVLFSVFIGVFGPRIGNRQQAPAGVTLIELAEAVVARSQPQFAEKEMELIHGSARTLTDEDFEARVDQITQSGVAMPMPAELGMEAISVQRVRLPGGSGALVVLRTTTRGSGWAVNELASITMLEDEDRFTVYDRFSRPIALPMGEVFSIGDGGAGSGPVDVFREGEFVVAVHARSPELARRLVAAIQSAGARRAAVRRDDRGA